MSPLGSRLRAEGHRLIAEGHAKLAEAASLSVGDGAVPDDLIPAPGGLEVKAFRGMVESGELDAARIGRKLYVRRSALLAAIDRIAAKQRAARVQRDLKPGNDAAADYVKVVALARGKRAGGTR